MDVFDLSINGTKVSFSVEDSYSKSWFFPNYEGGKIHEKAVTELLIKVCKSAKCFIDVGTNLGFFTCVISKLYPNIFVYGFEMDKNSFDLLRKNVKLNDVKNVEINNLAISDKEGQVYFKRQDQPDPTLSITSKKINETIPAESISLDSFFEDKKIKPDVLKIDVEGSEMLILKGMKKLLTDFSLKLFIEIHPHRWQPFGTTFHELFSFLSDLGYQLFEIIDHRNQDERKDVLKKVNINSEFIKNSMLYTLKE